MRDRKRQWVIFSQPMQFVLLTAVLLGRLIPRHTPGNHLKPALTPVQTAHCYTVTSLYHSFKGSVCNI